MNPQQLKEFIMRYLRGGYYSVELMPVLRIALTEIIKDIDDTLRRLEE